MLAYSDFNDELCLPCSSYSAAMSKCTACSSDGTKVTCTECGTTGFHFLSTGGSSCV